jgi:hypothetical protein
LIERHFVTANVPARKVPADLVEATPGSGALGQRLLATPLLLFLAWVWVDLFAHFSPLPWYWLDALLGLAAFALLLVLPLGVLAHAFITALPGVFQNAGWDVQPLEPVAEREQYLVRYVTQARRRAPTTWPRLWLRAAQGWVYLEIFVILGGAVAAVPLFFSAMEFGFGS